jgi:hypothetical protein
MPINRRKKSNLQKNVLLSTHENSLVLGSGGPGKPDRYLLYVKSLGWFLIVSCVSELILLFSVVFLSFYRPAHECDFKIITC